MKIKNKGWIFLLIIMALLQPVITHAENDNVANQGRFGVTPEHKDHQKSDKGNAFYLQVKPNQEEVLSVRIKNYSKEELKLKVSLNHAGTSDGGAIDYSNSKPNLDSTVPFNIQEIVTTDTEDLILPPLEEKVVNFTLKIPEKEFKGHVLGGINVTEKTELTEEEKKKTVVNRFSYSIPVDLVEKDEVIDPKISLKGIKTDIINGSPYISAQFINSTPVTIEPLSVKGDIYNKKTNEKFYTRDAPLLSMAPNSIFNFSFDLQNSEVISGTYIGKFTVIGNGREFKFEKEFEITREDAQKINNNNVFLESKKSLKLWQIILIVVIIVIIIFIIYKYIKTKNSKNKKSKNKKSKNKKSKNKKSKSKQSKSKHR